jgi:CheY-like chemotaxis protein
MADPVGGSRRTEEFPDLHGARILVLEDDPDASELIVEALRLCRARVWAAQMAEQARPLVAEVVPQLILCDLALPREDGISFVRWLRTQPLAAGGSAAVVAYTAYDDYFLRASNADGFAAIVKKPADPGMVCRTIADLLHPPSATSRRS